MAVITISRQHGSWGDEIAARVCEMLGYRFFDKRLMAEVASEMALAPSEVVDFSEDTYKVEGFLERLLGRGGPRVVARVGTWQETPSGARTKELLELDETDAVSLVKGTIEAAYRHGNLVIVGRGGQVVLKDKPDVLHVRLEAPLEVRVQCLQEREKLDRGMAQELVATRDKATTAYLRRFYDVDGANPLLYHMTLNTGKLTVDTAAHLIVNAVSYLPSVAPRA